MYHEQLNAKQCEQGGSYKVVVFRCDSVTFWPDREGCPAAGYVALSRVRKDADYLLGGASHIRKIKREKYS